MGPATESWPQGPIAKPDPRRSPQNGRFPLPVNGARFGDFEWQSSTGEDVVAEIAEFSYQDEERLVLLRPRIPGAPRHVHVSAGQLWSTGRRVGLARLVDHQVG